MTSRITVNKVPSAPYSPYRRIPGDNTQLPHVDVALVMESTYPYLKGGLSGVVHHIILNHPHLTFGIIFTTWDSSEELSAQYPVPKNVKWIDVIYLSFEENKDRFVDAVREGKQPERAARALMSALSDPESMWTLYDDYINPLTRTGSVWSALTSRTMMKAMCHKFPAATLNSIFWGLRDFFSLAWALTDRVHPSASVYHAHTTGYASVIAAAAARQNFGEYFLTEHNLYARDATNTVLGRRPDHKVTLSTPAQVDNPQQQMWALWYTHMPLLTYPKASQITYLYPSAIDDARALGLDTDRVTVDVLPNAIDRDAYLTTRRKRAELATANRCATALHNDELVRLACVARVVPIKGQLDLIEAVAEAHRRGATNIRLDLLGPVSHDPDYVAACRTKIREHNLESVVTVKGTVRVDEALVDYDATVLSSHNEAQPLVILEAMTAGLPVIATDVGGVRDMVASVGLPAAGLVLPVGDTEAWTSALMDLAQDPAQLEQFAAGATARADAAPCQATIMSTYNDIYARLGVAHTAQPAQPARPARPAQPQSSSEQQPVTQRFLQDASH